MKLITDSQNNRIEDASLSQTFELFDKLPQQKEAKFFIKNEENIVFKFTCIASSKYLVDFPLVPNKIHKQCYATRIQVARHIRTIFNKTNLEALKGFTDVPVRHFTLDQMLEFKREDEMLLKGKDPDMEKPTPKPAPKPEKAKSIASASPKKDIDKSSVHHPNKEIADTKPLPQTSSTPKGRAMALGEGFQI